MVVGSNEPQQDHRHDEAGEHDRALPHLAGARARARVFPQLTDRECDVLELVAQGLDNLTIARRLGLSDKTVRNHLSNVLNKLGVADRGAAIARARDAGLGQPS